MSLQTELLELFKFEESDGSKTFNIDTALNENWDKIDAYLKGVLLSDLSNVDEATLQAAVKVIVLSMVANNLTTTAANLLLDARQGKALGDALNAHLTDTDNPHGVTLAQLGAAAASHTHDASAIISGIMSVLRGGTGAATFTANYPLFGNGTGALQALAPLTAMARLGDGYGTCSTAASTTAKVVTLANFVRRTGSRVTVYFTYAVPASATMNVNSTSAAYMRYKGANITAGVIPAATYADFVFDGTYWQLVGTTNAPMNIVTGSYTGDGTYGSSNPTTITVGFQPKLLIVYWANNANFQRTVIVGGADMTGFASASAGVGCTLTLSSTGVSFYSTANATNQSNGSGNTYYYVAIG